MHDGITKKIHCPRCNSEAIYRYGRTKSGERRYLCILCKRQFTIRQADKERMNRPMCNLCGEKMYVYMRDSNKMIIRFRCSKYPKCKEYKIIKIQKEVLQ